MSFYSSQDLGWVWVQWFSPGVRGTQAGIFAPEESAGPAKKRVCLGEMAGSDQALGHHDVQASSGNPDHSLLHFLPGGSLQSGTHLSVSSLGLDAWREKKCTQKK